MPIVIVNITKNPKPSGEHLYEVRINQKPLFKFKHERSEPLSICFSQAAKAALVYECDQLISICEEMEKQCEQQ